ncbi:MAG: DUF2069 domain-containing protein [Noviherbaspirillum sp.]
MQNPAHKFFYWSAVASIVALIALCVAWELTLAPLRPGGSWLVLKVLPLLIPLRGILKRDIYTLQWSSMLILVYLAEGTVRGVTDTGLSAILAWIEVALVCIFFTCSLLFLRPYKKAAKTMAQQAIKKASESINE